MQPNDHPDPRHVLGFIAWEDTLERLDTLLLEYRHTQVNLIHNLRAPFLYGPLRQEEQHVWAKAESQAHEDSWFAILCQPDFAADKLAGEWVKPYPEPGDSMRSANTAGEKEPAPDIDDRPAFRRAVQAFWNTGNWSLDQKRHYLILRTLQDIKAAIVSDRLTLCWWALRVFGVIPPKDHEREVPVERLARFMVIRAGVTRKIYDYVQRLGDLQSQFERALDMGFQDHPRPSLTRRREQGIYTGYLADRCRDMERSIAMLLDSQNPAAPAPASRGPVMHRWSHDFTSQSFTHLDQIAVAQEKPRHASFVNSSYWMPERPDLQSVLAHEVAHVAVDRRYRNGADDALAACRDPFGRLLRLLAHCLHSFELREGNDHLAPRYRRPLIRELACDMLAATVEGHGYLLALFEEIAGEGLWVLFDSPDGRYDLGLAHHLERNGGFLDRDRQWYLRLCVTATWLEAVHHVEPPSPLDTLLVKGVRGVVDAMLGFLDRLRGPNRSTLGYWRSLGERLCALVQDSEATVDFVRWREKRSGDDLEDASHTRSGQHSAPWRFPRFARRLPMPVREHLYRRLLEQKSQSGHPLDHIDDEKDRKTRFLAFYFEDKKYEPSIPPLFQHIYDVPWQCMLTRSIDFLRLPDGARHRGHTWITRLQCHAAMGREFYQVALEFHYDLSRSAYHHLLILVRQLDMLSKKENSWSKVAPELQERLELWLRGRGNLAKRNQKWLDAHINGLDPLFDLHLSKDMSQAQARRRLDLKATDIAAECPALDWRDLYGAFTRPALERYFRKRNYKIPRSHEYETRKRTLEKVLRRKLAELAGIFADQEERLPPETPLRPLLSYINSTGLTETREKERGRRTERLVRALQRNDDDHLSDYYLIGRVAIAGSYTCADIGGDDSRSSRHLTHWLNQFENYDYSWVGERNVCPSQDEEIKQENGNDPTIRSGQHGLRYYQAVSGRYDVVAWIKTRPMCRCALPELDPEAATGSNPTEEFPSFFVRREQAIPVRMDLNRPWPDGFTEPGSLTVLAILSVTLTQRNARLDAIHRLLLAKENVLELTSLDGPLQVEQLGSLLLPNDRLFLSDGWGDLLLILSGNPTPRRLQEIFAIQSALFEDFMVDRTELMLTPVCIPIATASPHFHLSVQLRLMEDRTLEHGNADFCRQFRKNVADSEFWREMPGEHIALCRTPGRMDYSLTFPNLDRYLDGGTEGGRGPGMPQLFELFKEVQIDTIQTNIGIDAGGATA